ncbi:Fic family protein [Pontibacter toksunensis]|uniref:Fic family protein n=1 Tax=Pontibacter toksunensis TaxID=1332631 RepID=A0ABW6BY83_9BACT
MGNDQVNDKAGDQAEEELAKELQPEHLKVLYYALKPAKRKDILEEALGLANHTDNVRRYINALLEKGLLDQTIKYRPNSPLQQYVTTGKGREMLKYHRL